MINYYEILNTGDKVRLRYGKEADVVCKFNSIKNGHVICLSNENSRLFYVSNFGRANIDAPAFDNMWDIVSIVEQEQPFQVQEDYIEL